MSDITSTKGSDGFEPPKYVASLIAGVNDGAKAAQSGALVFALVGIYLLATAFSATDEDLLRGRAVTISQIGASLPVSFSFAIAPLVFVFLHIYTLARYDMLAVNVRQLLAELRSSIVLETDRERCRQLLANVEFVQALVAPPTSDLYSWVWPWLVRAVIVVFPVLVLLLVQINALRYQSMSIVWIQRTSILIDLIALVWFFHRNSLERKETRFRTARSAVWRWAGLLSLPVVVVAFDLLYLNVVPTDADPYLVRYNWGPPAKPPEWRKIPQYLAMSFLSGNPLDLLICPLLRWGCRYLQVESRILVDRIWDDKAIINLRSGGSVDAKALQAVEGLVLSDRSFRFALLNESSLFAADLSGSDLTKASLRFVNLPRARLSLTHLEGADLRSAKLPSAISIGAQLQGADLERAELQGAFLGAGEFQGANLERAELQGAYLSHANLEGANLSSAQLQGVDLSNAWARGAALVSAQLQSANLEGTQLQGALLMAAQLQGANLRAAQLQGADLRGALLWGVTLGRIGMWDTNLELSDLRSADFSTAPTDAEIKHLRGMFAEILSEDTKQRALGQLDRLPRYNPVETRHLPGASKGRRNSGAQSVLPPGKLQSVRTRSAPEIYFDASAERPALVSDPANPIFKEIPKEWIIARSTPLYESALAKLLADELATGGSAIANMIAVRVSAQINSDIAEDRSLYAATACQLIANIHAGKVRPAQREIDELFEEAQQRKLECKPTGAPSP
jgi:uncharacterized protein YjbI with pentapeptide repeats